MLSTILMSFGAIFLAIIFLIATLIVTLLLSCWLWKRNWENKLSNNEIKIPVTLEEQLDLFKECPFPFVGKFFQQNLDSIRGMATIREFYSHIPLKTLL